MKQILTLTCLFALSTCPSALLAASFTGMVTRVIDGDTIVVGTNVVRLAGIDAPERKQAFGREAVAALVGKVEGREVVVEWRRHGRYRRIIGTVFLAGQNANHELVKEGYAWFDPRYSSN
ncbi:MAG: thermonuclease family protein, partial [Lentisphaerae bacterium]|nr:thermonuclease family protein [Lentisphaerota bacterium]